MSTDITPRDIAIELMLDAARDVDALTISERLDETSEPDEADGFAEQVAELIRTATVSVGWPATEQVAEADALDLDAIEARVNATTPGPWGVGNGTDIVRGLEVTGRGSYTCIQSVAKVTDEYDREDWGREEFVEVDPEDDAKFIAAARADVPALVAEVRRLRAERDAIQAEFAEWCSLATVTLVDADAESEQTR